MCSIKKYLIICTLRLGDVLLSTPIANSIRVKDPEAQIDYLVLKGSEGILEGNPDINQVIALPHRTSFIHRIKEYFSLWRKYDVALSPVSSDRARLYGFIAGKKFYGFYNEHTSQLSKFFLTDGFLFDNINTHTVIHNQKLLSFIDIKPSNKVIPPFKELNLSNIVLTQEYIVIHPYPKFNYKMWDKNKWVELVRYIQERNIAVVLTGGSEKDEIEYCKDIEKATQCKNLAGKLSLGEVAHLIKGAKYFVGPDTGITHIAAATGVRTIALFGPTNPVKWGPWPYNYSHGNPWSTNSNNTIMNISIIQGEQTCIPCGKEGCKNTIISYSDCLLLMPTKLITKQLNI
ncbi:MAG: hypothetical protein B7X47_00375 [Ferrovum sp. 34-44-207]|nr:MAG: hypothetical protein B7X47_00375 [Ferrovum sp. 34-44-207]